MMKIKVGGIPEEGLSFQFSQEGHRFLRLLPENEKAGFSLQKVGADCFAKKVGSTVFLQVNLETAVALECSRCLEPVMYPVKASFTYTLVPEGSDIAEEDISESDEDLNVGHYREDVIDLEILVLEQIVLRIPIKPLCRDGCKGLCVHCGINLNTASCGCETEVFNPRFAELRNFKVAK